MQAANLTHVPGDHCIPLAVAGAGEPVFWSHLFPFCGPQLYCRVLYHANTSPCSTVSSKDEPLVQGCMYAHRNKPLGVEQGERVLGSILSLAPHLLPPLASPLLHLQLFSTSGPSAVPLHQDGACPPNLCFVRLHPLAPPALWVLEISQLITVVTLGQFEEQTWESLRL